MLGMLFYFNQIFLQQVKIFLNVVFQLIYLINPSLNEFF